MIRRMGLILGLGWILLAAAPRPAEAQFWNYNYGGWGWGGGWGQSPEGAALQGAGFYAMGAGQYNLNTAQAANIDAQTAMMWNEYVASVTRESARQHELRVHQEFRKNQSLYDARQRQLRENPTRQQVDSGDALNAALVDLTDTRLGSAAYRAARAHISASLIATVPFRNNVERVTLMLDDLRKAVKWPEVFEGERFAAPKKTFDELVARVREEAAEGEIQPKTLSEARAMIDRLRADVTGRPLSDPADQQSANRFLNACSSLLGLLGKPDIQPALLELRKVQDTSLGNLLGFMNVYNLRFGPATTPREKIAYQQLFEIMDQARDTVLAEAKLNAPASGSRPDPNQATQLLQNLKSPSNSPRDSNAPTPPAAGAPR